MLTLFICDDNPLHLKYEADFISQLPAGGELELHCFTAPNDLLGQIRSRHFPDIAVLDIEMPKVDGISLAEELNRLCPQCRIIFLTGFTQYAYDAYYADHIWYVLKTDIEKYLPTALEKAISSLNATREEPYLSLPQRRTLRRMPLKQVLYLERITYRTKVKTADEELYVRTPPGELLQPLPAGSFIRCHQSFWVNGEKIISQVGDHFLLVDGTSIPISRTYRQSALEAFRTPPLSISGVSKRR